MKKLILLILVSKLKFITRALSPAKPLRLFIDDEKNYCVALFEDEGLDAAIGRNGMNII